MTKLICTWCQLRLLVMTDSNCKEIEKQPPSLELGSSCSIDIAPACDNNDRGPTLTKERRHCCHMTLYWITRYFLVSTSFYSAFITTLYGVSNLITINAVNFFCDTYSREEVLEHNQNVGSNVGVGWCYKINRLSFNDDAVQELNLDLYTRHLQAKNLV